MPVVKIAFSGKAGSGKSLAIETLKEVSGNIKSIKFADDLYQIMFMVQDYLGLENHKDGKFLQILGTEWGRNKDKNLWVNKFQRNLEEKAVGASLIVCDDVRMGNEFDCVKKNKFFTVRIKRNSENREESLIGRDPNHPSEVEMDQIPDSCFDMVINNIHDLQEFRNQVLRAYYRAKARAYYDDVNNSHENLTRR